jgi:hypothetical protein
MTWIDLTLLLLVAIVTALAAERRLTGLLVGLGGVLLLRPLLLLGDVSAFGALLAALAAGGTLALLGTRLTRSWALPDAAAVILGGAGGLLLSVMLLLATVTSLPIERNAHAQIVYPPQAINRSTAAALQASPLVQLGRSILLQPLLAGSGPATSSEQRAYAWLHDYLVVGTPWQ